MNIKLVLGIFLPVFLITILVILSNWPVGFDVNVETKDEIDKSQLFYTDYNSRSSFELQSITITNDYFMPRRYELVPYFACLISPTNRGIKLTASYSQGDSSISKGGFYSDYSNEKSIEISSNSEKTLSLFVQGSRSRDDSSSYTELWLVKPDKNNIYSYKSCDTVNEQDIVAKVPIKDTGSIYSPYGFLIPLKTDEDKKKACKIGSEGNDWYPEFGCVSPAYVLDEEDTTNIVCNTQESDGYGKKECNDENDIDWCYWSGGSWKDNHCQH